MPDDLPDWLDAEPAPDPPRRRQVLVVLACVPWILVAAMLVTFRPGSDGTRSATLGSETPASGHVVAGDRPAAADPHATDADPADRAGTTSSGETAPEAEQDPSRPPTSWRVTEHRGNWRVADGDGAATAIAVAVARAWLTGIAPTLPIEGITPSSGTTYLEHLSIEAVERPDAGAAVVTLLGVLLDAGEEPSARVVRVAVPVRETAQGPRPGGTPWWLPDPDLSPTPLLSEAVDDPDEQLAAMEAIERSGLRSGEPTELLALERTESWPWIARLRTTSATGETREDAVWLRRHLDGFAVAGLPLHPMAGPPEPAAPAPDEAPGASPEVEP